MRVYAPIHQEENDAMLSLLLLTVLFQCQEVLHVSFKERMCLLFVKEY
jgi:hypothetical protein